MFPCDFNWKMAQKKAGRPNESQMLLHLFVRWFWGAPNMTKGRQVIVESLSPIKKKVASLLFCGQHWSTSPGMLGASPGSSTGVFMTSFDVVRFELLGRGHKTTMSFEDYKGWMTSISWCFMRFLMYFEDLWLYLNEDPFLMMYMCTSFLQDLWEHEHAHDTKIDTHICVDKLDLWPHNGENLTLRESVCGTSPTPIMRLM